jgi:hypothetical protein
MTLIAMREASLTGYPPLLHPRRIRLQSHTLPVIFRNCSAMVELTAQRQGPERPDRTTWRKAASKRKG